MASGGPKMAATRWHRPAIGTPLAAGRLDAIPINAGAICIAPCLPWRSFRGIGDGAGDDIAASPAHRALPA